jgi:hypothetical protein
MSLAHLMPQLLLMELLINQELIAVPVFLTIKSFAQPLMVVLVINKYVLLLLNVPTFLLAAVLLQLLVAVIAKAGTNTHAIVLMVEQA